MATQILIKVDTGQLIEEAKDGNTFEVHPDFRWVAVNPKGIDDLWSGRWVYKGDKLTELYPKPVPPPPPPKYTDEQIKEQAHELIIAQFPWWKQSNMMYQLNLLREKDPKKLTNAEKKELASIITAFDWIIKVRKQSDQYEAVDPETLPDTLEWPSL